MKFILIIMKHSLIAILLTQIAISKNKETSSKQTEISINNQNNQDKEPESNFPNIDELYEHPAFTTGIKTASAALNRSVESIIDSLFYSLLDNEFKHPTNPDFSINLNTDRNVYNAKDGEYIIVDRIYYGPEYQTKIGQINNVPIHLGSYTHMDILDVYLRTDAQRLGESENHSFDRPWLNNWFGLLPYLTQILPPAFNPNYLFNPLRLIETPFVFPLNKDRFDSMQIGSIRSYGLNGGITLPFDLSYLQSKEKGFQAFLKKYNLLTQLPYAIFVKGEYRINVLRKSKNIAWVGLSKSHKSGHSLSGLIGKTYYLLSGAIKSLPWKGFPVTFTPINFEYSLADVEKYNLLYEFDLSKKDGLKNYKEAVKGNFSIANDIKLNKNRLSPKSFHFSKNTKTRESSKNTTNNYLLINNEINRSSETSEIEIIDQKGPLYVLESLHKFDTKVSNILIGSEEKNLQSTLKMRVFKIGNKKTKFKNKKNSIQNQYAYKNKSPYTLEVTYNIRDKFADTEEYNLYIKEIEQLSRLSLDDMPKFPIRSQSKIREARQTSYFQNPLNQATNLHVPPSVLGKFHATATLLFSYENLNEIIFSSRIKKQKAFAKAFQVNMFEMHSFESKIFPSYFYKNIHHYLSYPLRIFNIYNNSADSLHESFERINILEKMQTIKDPNKMILIFESLLNTSYPHRLIKSFLNLVSLKDLPRRVSLFVKPSSNLEAGDKVNLRRISQKIYTSDKKFPKPYRYGIANEKLNAFSPTNIQDLRDKPLIETLNIKIQKSKNKKNTSLLVNLAASSLKDPSKLKVYIRFGTEGRVHIGKYILAETVLELEPTIIPTKRLQTTSNYSFHLTGPKSSLSNFLYDKLFEIGGDFSLKISISEDDILWSKESHIQFKYKDGELKLKPI